MSLGSEHSVGCSMNGFSLSRNGTIGLNCDTYANPALIPPNNTWTHFAVTFDGDTLSVYANGNTTPVATWQPCSSTGPKSWFPVM